MTSCDKTLFAVTCTFGSVQRIGYHDDIMMISWYVQKVQFEMSGFGRRFGACWYAGTPK